MKSVYVRLEEAAQILGRSRREVLQFTTRRRSPINVYEACGPDGYRIEPPLRVYHRLELEAEKARLEKNPKSDK